MMTLLSAALQWLVGAPKLLSAGALLSIVLLAHQWWLERDARLKATGAQACQAEQQIAVLKAERDQARRVAEKAVAAIESEKTVTEELRNERHAITQEFAAYKEAASSDPRCLSDGVLNLLRGHGSDRPRSGG